MKYVGESDKKRAVEVYRGQKMQSLEYPGAWKRIYSSILSKEVTESDFSFKSTSAAV